MTSYNFSTARSGHARTVVGSISAAIVTLTLFTGVAALFAHSAAGHAPRSVTDLNGDQCQAATVVKS